jgi:hypothetical protein
VFIPSLPIEIFS